MEEILNQFSDLAFKIAEATGLRLEWTHPIVEEGMKQAKSGVLDEAAMAAAVAKATSSPGYKQAFASAISFLRGKWKAPLGGTRTIAAASSSGSAGARWERMMAERKQQEERKEASKKSAKLKEVAKTSVSAKSSRFDEAVKALRLEGTCISWLEYLQGTGKVNFEGSLGRDQAGFKACRELACKLIDPLLKSRNIYDDSQAIESDLVGALSSQTEDTLIQIVLEHYGLTDSTRPTYWFAKGLILHMNPGITIRCDGSAALAFYLLCQDPGFKGSIALVRQGEPQWSGHWFLVAGVAGDLAKEKIHSFKAARSGKPLKPFWCFVVDLWGAAFQKAGTAVGFPAFCVVGDWPIEILWKV